MDGGYKCLTCGQYSSWAPPQFVDEFIHKKGLSVFFNACFLCALKQKNNCEQKETDIMADIPNMSCMEKNVNPIVISLLNIDYHTVEFDHSRIEPQLRMKLVGMEAKSGTWICINEKSRDLACSLYIPDLVNSSAEVVVTYRRVNSFEVFTPANNSLQLFRDGTAKANSKSVKWVGGESSVKSKAKYTIDFNLIMEGSMVPSIIYRTSPLWLIPHKNYAAEAMSGNLFAMMQDENNIIHKEVKMQEETDPIWGDILKENAFFAM